MKIKVNRKDLTKHISIVQKAISSRTTMQILEGILIVAKDNILKLIASDTEISIETSLPAIVLEEGECVVNSRLFGDIIRKLQDDNIDIKVEQTNMTIKALKSEFNLQTQATDEFPNLPKIEDDISININANLFKESIRKTSFAVSPDETRIAFTGVLMDIDSGVINFVALDGFRMALKSIKIDSSEKTSAIIPARSLNELIKITDDNDEINIKIGKNQILFSVSETYLYSTLLSGEYFNYEGLIRNEHTNIVDVKKEDFQNSLERASLLAKEDKANLVKLDVKEMNVQITSNSEIGSVEENVEAEIQGEGLKIAFNSKYLLEGIKMMNSENIKLNFTDSINPCILKEEDDPNYIYLVLPVRLAN